MSLMGTVALIQQEILPRYAPSVAQWAIWEILPNWSLQTWLLVIISSLAVSALEGAYQFAKRIQTDQAEKGTSVTLLDALGEPLPSRQSFQPTTAVWRSWLTAAILVIVILLSLGYFSSSLSHRVSKQSSTSIALGTPSPTPFLLIPLTLRNLFDTDFSDSWSIVIEDLAVGKPRTTEKIKIPCRLLMNFNGKAAFFAFFISHRSEIPNTFTMSVILTGVYHVIVPYVIQCDEVGILSLGDTSRTWLRDLTLSGRVFVYHEDDLSLEELVALDGIYKQSGLSAEFRGREYLALHRQERRLPPHNTIEKAPLMLDIGE